MHKIFGWSAKRSGATQTIKGRDVQNKGVRVTDVVSIEATTGDGRVVATTANGAQFALIAGPAA
jgi:hypothetical protein